jgi:hypothetical protein
MTPIEKSENGVGFAKGPMLAWLLFAMGDCTPGPGILT